MRSRHLFAHITTGVRVPCLGTHLPHWLHPCLHGPGLRDFRLLPRLRPHLRRRRQSSQRVQRSGSRRVSPRRNLTRPFAIPLAVLAVSPRNPPNPGSRPLLLTGFEGPECQGQEAPSPESPLVVRPAPEPKQAPHGEGRRAHPRTQKRTPQQVIILMPGDRCKSATQRTGTLPCRLGEEGWLSQVEPWPRRHPHSRVWALRDRRLRFPGAPALRPPVPGPAVLGSPVSEPPASTCSDHRRPMLMLMLMFRS